MDDDFDLVYLAERRDAIDACAAWGYGQWGVQNPDRTLLWAQTRFTECVRTDGLPLSLVAINRATDRPVAMGSLWQQDGPQYGDHSPWIASLYVMEPFRGRGIAKALITRLEQEARRLGHSDIFVHTGTAEDLYRKLGYEQMASPDGVSDSLFHKTLT
jgi:GNAT superfamily N-acetyltransferase